MTPKKEQKKKAKLNSHRSTTSLVCSTLPNPWQKALALEARVNDVDAAPNFKGDDQYQHSLASAAASYRAFWVLKLGYRR
jgi:hypothetical protein